MDIATFSNNVIIMKKIKTLKNLNPTLCSDMSKLFHNTQLDPQKYLADMIMITPNGKAYCHSYILYTRVKVWIKKLMEVRKFSKIS